MLSFWKWNTIRISLGNRICSKLMQFQIRAHYLINNRGDNWTFDKIFHLAALLPPHDWIRQTNSVAVGMSHGQLLREAPWVECVRNTKGALHRRIFRTCDSLVRARWRLNVADHYDLRIRCLIWSSHHSATTTVVVHAC